MSHSDNSQRFLDAVDSIPSVFLMRRQPAGKTTPTLINASAAFIVFKRYLSPQYLNASTCRQGINVGVIKRLTVRHLTIEL
jgi:hypothetical protein